VIFYHAVHETRFSFQYFEFANSDDPIHVHCNATYCPLNDHSPSCRPACHNHVTRSKGGHVDDDMGYNDEALEVDFRKYDTAMTLNARAI
jgi:hypothetical protein